MARDRLGLLTLAACAIAYAAFQLVRPRLHAGFGWGWGWGWAPSFLLPIAMAATFDLAPRIRFRSAVSRAFAILAATAVAAVWFEGVVPLLVDASTGDWSDVAAMAAGGAVAALAPLVHRR